ncbi:HU family DNA-binding protein [Aestuariimicrobium sp. Y1814]|uniref:HU family DNA-binding protein n=1 Tax=Aestuariimicrobium sp. Y1814 TaxID=3418742 RepID=UPI003DA6F3FF
MNKRGLIDSVAASSDLDARAAEGAVDAVLAVISDALAGGDRVTIAGFGTFEVRDRSARAGRNPQTGEAIEIPASKAVAFKPAAALKEAVATPRG